ncbi:MAG: diaminopimelate decarboxylase [Pseudanabaenaceae cyanobacterium SKYGB_i_bin29]|nr:diaminopimelate decarboxylase [Pseudanabaenaceae cyanobacterium SKYG29]MDW8420868.1 diaminopimelate decarboxylase [Pseudanabaenaceae cyanobacterium SKYGB_i_bin29]
MTLSPNQQLLPLTAKVNSQYQLTIGGCAVPQLVQEFGSPLYILDEVTVRTACQQYREAFRQYYPADHLVLYASKAWSCLALCALVASEGLGIDVVSGGELYTALQAGVDPRTIYLHGNNKSAQEIAEAIAAGCTIVLDNWHDIKISEKIAKERQTRPRVMVRVTPGIDCHTHAYIRTGQRDSKFGFDLEELPQVFAHLQASLLECVGLHAHNGSQIFSLDHPHDLPRILLNYYQLARTEFGFQFTELNVGGGLGIRYTEQDDPPPITDWVKAVATGVISTCRELNLPLPKLLCEPGRSIVGPACVTAYTVGSSKVIPGVRTYVAVDGGMSDNPRPITYQAQYCAVVANRMGSPLSQAVTIAGKHCESGDVLIQDITLPALEAGDILVVLATGAYNYSMASNYNRLPRLAAVLVNGGRAELILRRETYADLLRQDCLPTRLRI